MLGSIWSNSRCSSGERLSRPAGFWFMHQKSNQTNRTRASRRTWARTLLVCTPSGSGSCSFTHLRGDGGRGALTGRPAKKVRAAPRSPLRRTQPRERCQLTVPVRDE